VILEFFKTLLDGLNRHHTEFFRAADALELADQCHATFDDQYVDDFFLLGRIHDCRSSES
jgi:hypothetical protein